jgi:hypothetical protein
MDTLVMETLRGCEACIHGAPAAVIASLSKGQAVFILDTRSSAGT